MPPNEPAEVEVKDLTHKKEYRFRIRAVNKIGTSEPNQFSKPVLAKDPWGKNLYKIHFHLALYYLVTIKFPHEQKINDKKIHLSTLS